MPKQACRSRVTQYVWAIGWRHNASLAFFVSCYYCGTALMIAILGATARLKTRPLSTAGRAKYIDNNVNLKTAFGKGKPLRQYPLQKVPAGFIASNVNRYLYVYEKREHNQLIPDRYEFFICRLLRDRLEAGDIYCRDSVRFRKFENDLIDGNAWRRNKDKLIERAGLPILELPVEEHLTALEHELEGRIAAVNKRIAAGENDYIKIKKRAGKPEWCLKYPGDKDDTNHPVFDGLNLGHLKTGMHLFGALCKNTLDVYLTRLLTIKVG